MARDGTLSDPLSFYVSLFPGASRGKERFMALASAVLRQACDLVSLMPRLASGFSFASASGVQLDALGASAGIPRQEGWEDETYRRVLLRKLRIWSWDGTNETAGEFLLPGETLKDNGNNSVSVHTDALPGTPEEFLPVPLGVKVIRLE